jgi:hypothetical protein
MKTTPDNEGIGENGDTPRLRLKLATSQDVCRELARLYRDGKSGQREVADVSRLANVLQILGRLIETSDIEKRLELLESKAQ